MKKIELVLEGNRFSSTSLHGYLYEPEGQVNKVIYVIHGMTEHMGRYEEFASQMIVDGIAVVGIDLKGHGKDNMTSDVASFGEDGWRKVLDELHLFYDYISHRYTNAKIYMLGFSLGSFLLREYINQYYTDHLDGVIIMGTGTQSAFVLNMILSVVKGEVKKVGYDQTTPLIQNLSFGEYNKKFKPNRTSSDWLCSDESSLDAYINDSLCKKDISAGLFYDLLCSMKRTSSKDAYENVKKDMPVFLISGTLDPVGNMKKGVTQVYKDMLNAGFKDVRLELVEGARHDVLHEYQCGGSLKAINLIKEFVK